MGVPFHNTRLRTQVTPPGAGDIGLGANATRGISRGGPKDPSPLWGRQMRGRSRPRRARMTTNTIVTVINICGGAECGVRVQQCYFRTPSVSPRQTLKSRADLVELKPQWTTVNECDVGMPCHGPETHKRSRDDRTLQGSSTSHRRPMMQAGGQQSNNACKVDALEPASCSMNARHVARCFCWAQPLALFLCSEGGQGSQQVPRVALHLVRPD